MIKKYFLKGKQLINKKLQQLQIQSTSIDYVQQQIPTKLKQPLNVLSKNIDLQSNQKYEMYFKMYPNHHISQYLLQKYNQQIITNKQTSEYILPKLIIDGVEETYIPKHDKQLQHKALIFKQVIEQYEQGEYKSNQALLCISVVHFHHKRGAQVQYTYPKNTITQSVQNLIIHHSMPDSSHNKNQDYNFFNFQTTIKGKKQMLFGVSYFKQIKVTQQLRQQNKQLTRSYLQKAISIISYLPLFGYLKLRLSPTIKMFFNDFNNFNIINQAYKDLNKSLVDAWTNISVNQLYIGSDLRTIINLFGVNDFYQIWKAILYQKRVVVFAHSSSSASSFILSLLTLFPGLCTFGIYSKEISKYMQGLRQYSLPLKLFSKDNFMSMSFHIQDFNLLIPFQKNNKGSFLVGTTNRLLKQQNDYGVQLLINLQNCTIQRRKLPHSNWQSLKKQQKIFIEQLNQIIQKQKVNGYSNSQDIIRNHFHNYLKQSIVKIIVGINQFKKFVKNCKKYQEQTKNKSKKRKSSKGNHQQMGIQLNQENDEDDQYSKQFNNTNNVNKQQNNKQSKNINNFNNNNNDNTEISRIQRDFPPMIPQQVINIPFSQLFLSPLFQFFLQFHNKSLPQIIKGNITPGLLIDNYKYLLKLQQNRFILYDWYNKVLSFGKGNPKNYQGKQLKFYKNYQYFNQNNQKKIDSSHIHIKTIYIGYIQHSKYHKNGYYLDKTQMYQGDYYKGTKQGYGKLTNTIHKYIGNFQQDLYSGQGQLVTSKQIYVGQFKQGLRNGYGKNQSYSNGLNYDGEWVNDKPQGNGIFRNQNHIEIIGMFKNGNIIEDNQVTLKYQNGNIYKGYIQNLLPHGKGFVVNQQGKLKMGIFQNGKLIQQLNQLQNQQNQQLPKQFNQLINQSNQLQNQSNQFKQHNQQKIQTQQQTNQTNQSNQPNQPNITND